MKLFLVILVLAKQDPNILLGDLFGIENRIINLENKRPTEKFQFLH